MTVWMCCSELNVKASSSFASWADHLLLFDRQWTCRRTQVRDSFCFICPPCIYLPSVLTHPDCSTVEFLAVDSRVIWTSQFPSKSRPSIDASPAELFGNWECWSIFFHGFPLLWRKPFRLARKGRSSWLSVPPSLPLSCFGSLQWIVRRKSHYLLLTEELFHNTESFERVSLCSCLQSRLKYVTLRNLTRWQFASIYFFYFHCRILCTLCYEELGIEITNSEGDTVKYWKHGGKKHRCNVLMRAV